MGEGMLQVNVVSLVEDVLKQHGKSLRDMDFASRKAEEAALRRYEAAGWLRTMVGLVGGKDFPAEPSEDEFRLALHSGIILCNALNKVQPGAVPKVVEPPSDMAIIPDGAALSAYQYFENVRNFLVALEEIGIPSFEVSDLEQGGKSSRIVNCVLALKSYSEWKQGRKNGLRKLVGNLKPCYSGKQYVRKNYEPFMNSVLRSLSVDDKCQYSLSRSSSSGDVWQESDCMDASHPWYVIFREVLSDKKREDIPLILENVFCKVIEEVESRLAGQSELTSDVTSTGSQGELDVSDIQAGGQGSRNLHLVEQQKREIQQLKIALHSAKEDMQMMQMKYQEEVNNLGKHLDGLAHATSDYWKVLEENRKLYNQVQDLKGNIRVYCRVRPFLPEESNHLSTVENIDEKTITITTHARNGKAGKKVFTFNKIFGPSASQEEVFADTQPLIRSVLDGYNVCIFAYGQTGSGKTYTMTGPGRLTEDSMGVNSRALSDLFLISQQRKETISYDVHVQMIEIYNEQVRDLLVSDGVHKKLDIRNNTQDGINVPNANLVPVTSTSDVIHLMNLGLKNRAVGATAMNDRSSRSHSCLTVHVQGRDLASGTILRGCMHLVDLAGSERVDKSEAIGDRLKEAQHINRSLSALGDVISSLAQKQLHVPYRNSKLTQLLQDSLGGQAKTLMFVHVSPEPDALGETISTLKFAKRVSSIQLGAAQANRESSYVKELKEQIADLKNALAKKEGEESIPLQYSRLYTPSVSRSSSMSRKQSFDIQDLFMNSPPQPPVFSPQPMEHEKGEERVTKKIAWNRRLSLDSGLTRKRNEMASTDDSDDLEAETSDSSDLNYQRKLNFQRSSSIPILAGSRVKRASSSNHSRCAERRSLIPSPSRRLSTGIRSPLHKPVRQPVSVDGRRKAAQAK